METKVKKKNEYERIEQHTLEKLKTFVSTFYEKENDKLTIETERLIREIQAEVEETENLLDVKVNKISKEVNERIKIANMEVTKQYDEVIY